MISIEVHDPLLMNMLRSRIRKLGFLSDGSFSGSIAGIPVNAVAALVKEFTPSARRSELEKHLRNNGIVGNSLEGLLVGFLKKQVIHLLIKKAKR